MKKKKTALQICCFGFTSKNQEKTYMGLIYPWGALLQEPSLPGPIKEFTGHHGGRLLKPFKEKKIFK